MKRSVATLFIALFASGAQAGSIAPHRAVYDLSLLRVTEGAGLTTAEGRLAFEVQGSACEGWTVNFRMANRFSPSEGEVKMVDTQSTAYESGDYLEMHYNQKEFVNGTLREENRIKVNRPSVDAEGSGERNASGAKPFTIPAQAFFPTQHQLKLMDLAEKGETRDSSLIFDGSDEEKIYRAITFIGGRRAPGSNGRDMGNPVAKDLNSLAFWPVSVSYFPIEGNADTPDYQVSFDLYENGVATGLVMDYGQFTLGGTLSTLETLKSEPCN